MPDHRPEHAAAARGGLHRPRPWVERPQARRAGEPPAHVQHRSAGWNGLSLDPSRGPGHRALGRGLVRAEPGDVRSRRHPHARHRRRLQRRRQHLRRAGHDGPQVRAQDPLHREDQPQRALQLSEHLRPGALRQHPPVLRHGSGRRGRHDLLGLGGIAPPAAGDLRGLRRGARARHVHRALVLRAQQRLQDEGRRSCRRRPTSRVRPTTWA